MRKIIVYIFLLGLIFSMAIPVNAMEGIAEGIEATAVSEPEISQEKAIELSKNTVKTGWGYKIDDKKHDPTVKFYEAYYSFENGEWLVSWTIQDDEMELYIDVVIDASTGMTNKARFEKYETSDMYSDVDQEIEILANEEAKEIAENFIKKIDPSKYNEVEQTSSAFDINYNYTIDYEYYFDRKVNGARVNQNFIFISVDGSTKEVTEYFCKWDDTIDFPSSTNIISKDEAKKLITDNMQFSLEYLKDYYWNDVYKPIYSLNIKNASAIDAKEGQLIDHFGDTLDITKSKNITDEQKNEIYSNKKAVVSHGKEINQDKAAEIIKKYVEDIYGEGYNVDAPSYFELRDNINVWSAYFNKQNESGDAIIQGGIEIDALTERLIYAATYLYNKPENIIEEKTAASWEAGYDKAIEIISKYYPDKIKDIETEIVYGVHPYDYDGDQKLEYQYIFPLKINGFVYKENYIAVILDANDYSINEIELYWEDIELPQNENILNKAEAEKIYFEEYEPDLVYVKLNRSKDINNPQWETRLIYTLPFEYYMKGCIDAVTGELLDKYGTKIEKDNNYDLEAEVTRIQAIKILLDETNYSYYGYYGEPPKFTDINYEDENYEYIEMAVGSGLIENSATEFKGEEKITREELAELIVKVLDYDDLAKKNDMYKVSFSDSYKISKDKIGAVAICSELGILEAKNNKFRPKEVVKNIELAVAISNMSKYLD
ncbi:MAG: S-layer homology domain-containing protein [Clostridia bacterium]|nr:S-layer homology domain-containing protein [Clostridia bacterium]